ncbi:hypothetical protein ACF1AE_05240 [Streptomyces sp. NPDC014986]|uniref:hypothetical protein n=1 Tax=Streptomyces sp. NPDC014986 TaxID=3364934 RepID=UPI0036F658C0
MLGLITRRLTASAIVLTAVGVLTGCSGPDAEKNYDVPESLCGISLPSDVTTELLPPGDKIDVHEKNPVPSLKRCQVNVDGEIALRVSQEWWEEGDTVLDVAQGVPQVKSAVLTDDSDSLLTGTGAVQQRVAATWSVLNTFCSPPRRSTPTAWTTRRR